MGLTPWSVHPHACGDFVGQGCGVARKSGTPPRVWGLLDARVNECFSSRYTPTRVGTSGGPCTTRTSSTVHPHACGDFPFCMYQTNGLIGTPPRVWGLREGPRGASNLYRYTPTRVGTSDRLKRAHSGITVHPHACGDFGWADFIDMVSGGTPPRVWGLRVEVLAPFGRFRYTPTRVGTSAPTPPPSRLPTVHPHACGDFVRLPKR